MGGLRDGGMKVKRECVSSSERGRKDGKRRRRNREGGSVGMESRRRIGIGE